MGTGTSNKPFKFHRVPYIQRVVAVGANDTGALSALRSEFVGERIGLDNAAADTGRGRGRGIERDLERVRPWMSYEDPEGGGERVEPGVSANTAQKDIFGAHDVGEVVGKSVVQDMKTNAEEEEEAEEVGIEEDVKGLEELWRVMMKDEIRRKQSEQGEEGTGTGNGLFADRNTWTHGADLASTLR